MKTATHELGHMLSMKHCILYACNMCGSNHREEADRRPLALCPECVAKLGWATQADLKERYRDLAAFLKKHGFKEESAFYEKSLARIADTFHNQEP
jgi:archaemetzincin